MEVDESALVICASSWHAIRRRRGAPLWMMECEDFPSEWLEWNSFQDSANRGTNIRLRNPDYISTAEFSICPEDLGASGIPTVIPMLHYVYHILSTSAHNYMSLLVQWVIPVCTLNRQTHTYTGSHDWNSKYLAADAVCTFRPTFTFVYNKMYKEKSKKGTMYLYAITRISEHLILLT